MKSLLKFVAIGILAVVASGPLFAQSNSLVGTWKLNLEKSKFNPGPGPKSMTRTVEAQGDGVKYTFDGVSGDGTAIAYSFAVSFDGKDNAITGSMPRGADSISANRIDSNTFDATFNQGRTVIANRKCHLCQDREDKSKLVSAEARRSIDLPATGAQNIGHPAKRLASSHMSVTVVD